MKEVKKKILYFIQLPPPAHGVTTMNNIVYNSETINNRIEKHLLELRFSDTVSSLQKLTLKKIILSLCLVFKLIKKIISIKPDIVYFTINTTGLGFIRDVFFVMLIKLSKRKPVYHIHNKGISVKAAHPVYKCLYKYIFSNSTIIQLSENILKKETGSLGLKNTRFFVVGNGIELASIPEKTSSHTIHLLFFSNLIPEKGIFILLQAFLKIFKQHKNLSLTIMGAEWNKKATEKIHAFIHSNKIGQQTLLIKNPSGEDVRVELARADIFVLPTFSDSFPLVILEAMQLGLPIISTYEGAIPEIIENGTNGLLVQQQNIEELKEKIELLIHNSLLRKALGRNAKKKFFALYTKEVFESNMRCVLEEILGIS